MIAETRNGQRQGEGGASTMSEEVFYDSGSVQITDSRFVAYGRAYQIQSITSVRKGHNVEEAKHWIPGIATAPRAMEQ